MTSWEREIPEWGWSLLSQGPSRLQGMSTWSRLVYLHSKFWGDSSVFLLHRKSPEELFTSEVCSIIWGSQKSCHLASLFMAAALSSLPVAGFQPQEPFAVLGDHCLDTQSQKGFLSTLPVNLMFSEQIFFGQACRTPSSLTRGIMQCVLTNTMWAPGHLNLWSGPSGPLSVRTQLASLNLIIFVLSR